MSQSTKRKRVRLYSTAISAPGSARLRLAGTEARTTQLAGV